MADYRSTSGLLKDYYGLLGVARHATRVEIDRAFKRAMARYAPRLDPRTVADPGLRAESELSFQLRNEKAQELNESYQVLSDPRTRAEYDALVDGRGSGQTTPRGVRLLADPPILQFGEVNRGASLLELRLVAEPVGQSIPADVRIAAPSWLDVQADGLGWGGYAAASPLRLRVRLLPERLFSYGLTHDRIVVTWSGGRLDVDVTAFLPSVQARAAAAPRGFAKAPGTGVARSRRGPSRLRLVLLQLLGLLTILGVVFFFQPAPKFMVLGLALLVSVLCLAVETRAFSDIEHRPWYYKGLSFIVLVGMLPVVAFTALIH